MEKEKLIRTIESVKAEHLTGIVGSPVGHSLSPFLHEAAFSKLGMKGYKYIKIEADKKFLPEAVEILKEHNFLGFNVTMPDKEAITYLCDELSDEAKLMHSVNTVKIVDGKLLGYNTDCMGFYMALKKNNVTAEGKNMILMGSGGAARAILTGACINKVKRLDVFARPGDKYNMLKTQVEELEKAGYQTEIRLHNLNSKVELYRTIEKTDILVNGTSVGMDTSKPADNKKGPYITNNMLAPKTLIPDTTCYHTGLFVADVVYFPKMTRFLEDAKDFGCRYMNGLDMLFFQADLAFKIWHDKEMPIEILEKQ